MKYGILSSDATSRYTKRSLDRTFRETLTFLRSWSQRSEFDTKDLEKAFFSTLPRKTVRHSPFRERSTASM